ncbi:glycosyltransferase family A protein [Micromonospora sp. NBC_00421]|uniref:glycosyltransferase family A protein n=1 Tax=Micromonospora sp. NBC_00421 TaxID=2975976 RepID=UPI002E206201
MTSGLFHHTWTDRRRDEPVAATLRSPLLQLHMSSDVDPLLPEQIERARGVLTARAEAVARGVDLAAVQDAQRQVVEAFLAGRSARFPQDQYQPLADAARFAAEGRDIFLVIKFMDEAPHIEATFQSLLHQHGVDLGRVVIVAVDNNSTDGSDEIVKRIRAANDGPIRIVYLNQAQPGAGHAARLGVDSCIATVREMCLVDGDWRRLQTAIIAVSDGDTVYHPHVLRELVRVFEESPTVDGVMPFLTYKLTAALRLFANYVPAYPDRLARHADLSTAVGVPVDLSTELAFPQLPRHAREVVGDLVRVRVQDVGEVEVPLCNRDEHGRRFGVLRDPAGRLAYLLEDRTLVLAEAPVSGDDAALTFLENGQVGADEMWRWHAVIGHDIFLSWLFAGMGAPEEMIYPDTSDALKAFRVWAAAIGGQHQLRRPGLRIVTGSDYQSGRVLQATGCTVRLASAEACAQTETDRLIKMARNLMKSQAVFYGQTRDSMIERASGLYVHMTRIQGDIEDEVRAYDDEAFRRNIFPERVLFPLRWMLQNALRFYAHDDPEAQDIVRERFLGVVFGEHAADVEKRWFSADVLGRIQAAAHDERPDLAERVAEQIIAEHYADILTCYQRTLRDYFRAQRLPESSYEWLLSEVDQSRNAMREAPPEVDPSAVWEGQEFVIDIERGQVVRMKNAQDVAS